MIRAVSFESPRSRSLPGGLRLLPCLVVTVALAGPVGPSPAHASPPEVSAGSQAVEVHVSVIHALKSSAPSAPAPSVRHLHGQLSRSFRDYNDFKPLSSRDIRVDADGSSPLTLPNGTRLVLRHDGTRDGYIQLHLSVGGLRTTIQVKPGAVFFQAGRAFDGGILVLAFEVGR